MLLPLIDALTLEQEALKLSPLSRIRLANLPYTSLEVEADREWNREAIDEYASRYQVSSFHLRSDPAK